MTVAQIRLMKAIAPYQSTQEELPASSRAQETVELLREAIEPYRAQRGGENK